MSNEAYSIPNEVTLRNTTVSFNPNDFEDYIYASYMQVRNKASCLNKIK